MVKNLSFLLALFLTCLSVNGRQVTEQEAWQKAQHFIQGKPQMSDKRLVRKSMLRVAHTDEVWQPLYVFSMGDGRGFVVVSGDDRTTDILGYSNTAKLDTDSIPLQLSWWLGQYALQIEAINTNKAAACARIGAEATAISPLLLTSWNQWGPYNYMCPNVEGIDYDESGYEDNMRCPTGCVATALAQLMHYWQWPKTCPALDGYVTATNGFKMKALPATIFKWDKIRTSYLEAETGEAADAVAELMRYCGQAVHMDYRYREAGASLRGKEWVELFDFSQAAQCIQRDSYSQKEWEHIVYDELSNGHPVLYSGTDEEGHQFIIDGYDGQGLFHINWGWGEYDGYFVLSVADPYRRGDDSGYRYDQEAWIGVQPAHGSVVASPYVVLSDDGQTVTFYYDEHRVNRGGIAINETKYAKSAYSSIVSAAFDASFANYHPTSTAAWFCECRNLKDITGMEYLNTEYVTDMSCMFMYCKSLTSLDLSRFQTEKVKDIYYMFFFCSSLTTIYANEDLWSMGSVTESSNMFLGCTNLVGGNGTAFSSDNTDATYARVDKEDAPGYLTNRTANGITPVISKREPESYYLLDGRMANQKAARKGIYIANGRKVMVK